MPLYEIQTISFPREAWKVTSQKFFTENCTSCLTKPDAIVKQLHETLTYQKLVFAVETKLHVLHWMIVVGLIAISTRINMIWKVIDETYGKDDNNIINSENIQLESDGITAL